MREVLKKMPLYEWLILLALALLVVKAITEGFG